MQTIRYQQAGRQCSIGSAAGFTLVELLVAMVIGAIVLGVIFATHNVQQRTFRQESMKLATMQNARAAMNYLESEVRMAGYDRPNSGLFGLTGIAEGTISFTADMGASGNTDNGTLDADETITYALYNEPDTIGTGATDLGRTADGSTRLVAEGIEAIGFAYAFDSDNDGELDFHDADPTDGLPRQPDEHIIWAADRDGDGVLDKDLDTNADGEIDVADAGVTLDLPTLPGGGTSVNMDRIRAVRIMLLARSKNQDLNYQDTKSYWVGVGNVINGSGYHRRLFVSTVKCRNLGL